MSETPKFIVDRYKQIYESVFSSFFIKFLINLFVNKQKCWRYWPLLRRNTWNSSSRGTHWTDICLYYRNAISKIEKMRSILVLMTQFLVQNISNLYSIERYETSDPFLRFSEQQLAEIRKIKLSKVFCDNSDSIDTIQRDVMDLPDTFL